jgi:catechol 2,3-dioxygenase-like lactoylglutathione lyase family enzyme
MTAHRFHVHVRVADLDASLRFYTQLFGADPSVRKPDYAKWMLDDPRLNFAISSGRAGDTGIAHLGLQADTAEALAAIGARLAAADAIALAETDTTCCYAHSDKFWARDPQGVRWEAFHSHGEATSYHAPDPGAAPVTCCGPGADAAATTAALAVPASSTATAACCDSSSRCC